MGGSCSDRNGTAIPQTSLVSADNRGLDAALRCATAGLAPGLWKGKQRWSCSCSQDATQAFNNFSIDFYKNIKKSINRTVLQNSCGFCTFCLKKVKFYKTPPQVFKIPLRLLHTLQYI